MSPTASALFYMVATVALVILTFKFFRRIIHWARFNWRLVFATLLALVAFSKGSLSGKILAVFLFSGGLFWAKRHSSNAKTTANLSVPNGGVVDNFNESDRYAVAQLTSSSWPQMAHSVGLSQHDPTLSNKNDGSSALSAVLALATSRSDAFYYQGENVYRVPVLVDYPYPTPIGFEFKIAPLPGQPLEFYADRVNALALSLRVPSIRVSAYSTDLANGHITMTVRSKDPLATSAPTGIPAPVNDMNSISYGVGEDGYPRTISLSNMSGWAVGGVPGSGKTASISYVMASLAQNPAIQFVVLDGKGGSDWSWLQPRASSFSNNDENFSEMTSLVNEVYSVMRHRISTQKAERGSSNFWSMPLDPDHPAIILLVDECQTIFETAGMSKDEKAEADVLRRKITALVKKGRSAGIVTVLMTQKPTADALPTSIRDNCGLRTAFRVLTREAAESILGAIPAGTEIMPTDIASSTPGVAVLSSDRGGFERVRYGYISESDSDALGLSTAELRRSMQDFLPEAVQEDEPGNDGES